MGMCMPVADVVQSKGVHPVDLPLLSVCIRPVAIPRPSISRARAGSFGNENLAVCKTREKLAASLVLPPVKLTVSHDMRDHTGLKYENLAGRTDRIGDHAAAARRAHSTHRSSASQACS